MKSKMFDVAMSVGPQHLEISKLSIRAILEHSDAKMVYVITNNKHFNFYQESTEIVNHIILVDEDTLIPGTSISTLREFLTEQGHNPGRAGWYLQQFLTMAACTIPEISDYYLILDSDTVFVRDVEFFDNQGRVLYVPEKENHAPYFETYEKLLRRKRSEPHSFIAEHIMANKQYMQDLINAILNGDQDYNEWPFVVMRAINKKHLSGAGFADYETYGNFVASEHPSTIRPRKLRHLRNAAKRFGAIPGKEDLFRLSILYHYASFEAWNPKVKIRISLEKLLSKAIFFFRRP